MGSITAHYFGFVAPSIADFGHSIELITMVVVGGMASVVGSIVGVVLLTALPQLLASFEGLETIAFGAILILCVIFMPKGALVPGRGAALTTPQMVQDSIAMTADFLSTLYGSMKESVAKGRSLKESFDIARPVMDPKCKATRSTSTACRSMSRAPLTRRAASSGR